MSLFLHKSTDMRMNKLPLNKLRVNKLPFAVSLIVLASIGYLGAKGNSRPSGTVNSIQTIISDMQPPHQGRPRGVPQSYDWAAGPRIGMGNNPKEFRAMTAWGQLYEAAEGNSATNSRVQIRNIRAYLLSKRDGRWHLLQRSRVVEGAAYREDFAKDINKPTDVRNEKDGSISVKAGNGYNFHFWPKVAGVRLTPMM